MSFVRIPEMRADRWWPAAMAALLWALAAGSASLWWLHFPSSQPLPVNEAGALPAPATGPDPAHAMRALGQAVATMAPADAQRRFQLVGVIAADTGEGSALLAVDGQPAQAFVQGQTVVEGWRLQSVGREGARLSATEGGALLELALPDRP